MSYGEIFFFVGVTMILISVLFGIAAFVIFKILLSRVGRQLDQEYGPQEKQVKNVRWR